MKTAKPNNNKFKTAIYIILIILVAFLVYEMFTTGSKGELISQTEFLQKLEDEEITDVFAQGGVVKVRKVDSEIKKENFPRSSDYYFTYSTSDELGVLQEKINLFNSEVKAGGEHPDAVQVGYTSEVQGESIISKITPFLSIIVIIVIGFMVFKMLASTNKGAMAFGKSRARQGENVKVKFSDVAGADEEKAELQEIVEFLKNPQKFTELGARIPKGVLLVGPPGTGKTLLAKAIAGESNVPFYSISGSDFVEMYVGVGASRVRDLFDTAKKNMPCIVFIDEIDAVGRQRGAGTGGGNDEREQTLNQLLVEMDGFEANTGIIVLAATNRSDVLDPALMRPGRFDRQIYVNIPDVKGRENILKIHAKNKPLSDEINFNTLARITSGFTGADLENMLNEAAILAARAGRTKIIMSDLTEGINKVIMGPQKKSRVVTDRDKKITAFHESGHAILGKLLTFCDEVQEVSIIPRGMAAGYTMSRPDNDDHHLTLNKLNDNIAMTMGGRIAEEIVFKDISTGASNDIKHATDLARKMVTEWGMSKKLGFLSFGSDGEVFLGRDYQVMNKYSEKTASEIDDEILAIIKYNYTRAKKILQENLQYLNEMSDLLLDKETIYQEEVDMLMAGKSAKDVADFMTKKENEEKERQEKAKKEREELKKNKEQALKLKTAEALAKAGVISQKELAQIRKETAEIIGSDKVDNCETPAINQIIVIKEDKKVSKEEKTKEDAIVVNQDKPKEEKTTKVKKTQKEEKSEIDKKVPDTQVDSKNDTSSSNDEGDK